MTTDLFREEGRPEVLCPGAFLLPGFARDQGDAMVEAIAGVTAQAPFRHLVTPGGHAMSVAMSNCGDLGWVTDRRGYRYQSTDPDTGKPWPAMPALFYTLARDAAASVGFVDFIPDACLINRYQPGAKMALHQDRNEEDFSQPIVSVSLGTPVVFQFGGSERRDKPLRVPLEHGDVVVWGGPARLRFHGILPLKAGHHPVTGNCRFNLTLRRAR